MVLVRPLMPGDGGDEDRCRILGWINWRQVGSCPSWRRRQPVQHCNTAGCRLGLKHGSQQQGPWLIWHQPQTGDWQLPTANCQLPTSRAVGHSRVTRGLVDHSTSRCHSGCHSSPSVESSGRWAVLASSESRLECSTGRRLGTRPVANRGLR